ncbi:hypothetical protein G3570_04700 [Balneolaceae bacterium YR4-1]|uniref:Sulfotransferase domain-containing protein n=1 Tax=Halalkalibaculum roseum TaxID=2709311 RepID=A0A6M1SKT1_9BACT|nr:hypothetical protein [Halalkalibaculum roseum]NGP75921.1 hypothetical protein [Halalkalibaculum roseum]
MKKLIIHIGYPKTATTSLQLNLLGDLWREHKIEYINHLKEPKPYLGNIRCYKNIQSIISGRNYSDFELKNELKSLEHIKKSITVISAETLSTIYPDHNFANLDSFAYKNAQKFKETFSGYFDVIEIVIGIRAQREIVHAVYKQWYNEIVGENPIFEDFTKWLEENFSKSKSEQSILFNYNIFIQEYCKVFGRKNVHILLYEDLLHDKNMYYNKLAFIFDTEKSKVQTSLERNIRNKSNLRDDGKIEIPRSTLGQKITSPFRRILRKNVNSSKYDSIKRIYHAIIPESIRDRKIGANKAVRQIKENEANYLKNRFKDSNLKLISSFDFNKEKMKKYKYI